MGALARHGRTETKTDASPEAIWRIICDVTRVGEWSHECYRARLLGDAAQNAAIGVRFRGSNRSGIFRWSRTCVFTVVDPPRTLAWKTIGLLAKGDSTEWRIDLEPTTAGTRITQTYLVLHAAPGLDRLYWWLIKAHRDRREALQDDLERLAALAATGPQPLDTGTARSPDDKFSQGARLRPEPATPHGRRLRA